MNLQALIFMLSAAYLLFLLGESLFAVYMRKRLRHVIHVNGTRGKSTVTRLIDAGLRAGGLRVYSKSTGTLPMTLDTAGSEQPIERHSPANIREQLGILHQAAKANADVLVIECMAIRPELQFASQHRMLRADIGVITNARIDHTDVMGNTQQDVMAALMHTVPRHGTVFTTDEQNFLALSSKAQKLSSQAILATPQPGDEALDFADNVAVALAVCAHLGVPRDVALRGMQSFRRDPYALSLHRLSDMAFVNALSANDVQSALLAYQRMCDLHALKGDTILLFNNRADRPARSKDVLALATALHPSQVILLGADQGRLAALLHRAFPSLSVLRCKNAQEVPLAFEQPSILFATGNIKDEGICLMERVLKEAAHDA